MVDLVEGVTGLEAAERIARHDLARLNYPPANWVPERIGPDGKRVLDVLVVGAGMCGQTAGWNLLREGIRNIRVIDRNPHGHEGPWNTTARMPILRSPKHLTGPDLGVPSLTFRAWYEAQHGADGWEELYKVLRLDWMDYLVWVRKVVDLPVENGVALVACRAGRRSPEGDAVDRRDAPRPQARAGQRPRRLGRLPLARLPLVRSERSQAHRQGLPYAGRDRLHASSSASASACWACSQPRSTMPRPRSKPARARRSATPAARTCRRSTSPRASPFPDSSAATACSTTTGAGESTPTCWPPARRRRTNRCCGCRSCRASRSASPNPWLDVIVDDAGVTVKTTKATERFDAVFFGTGFDVDIAAARRSRPSRRTSNSGATRARPRRPRPTPRPRCYPYLGPGFELMEKEPGRTPLLAQHPSLQLGQHPEPRRAGRRHPRPVCRLAAPGTGNFA